MKKIRFLFIITLLFAFIGIINVNAESVPITNEDLKESLNNGTIKLEQDIILTNSFETTSDIEVIDLNGFTLTLKKPINIVNNIEIKNGKIERSLDYTSGTLINVNGENVTLTLNGVVLDGNNVNVNVYADLGGHALYIGNSASLLANNSEFNNNTADFSVYDGAAIKAENAKSIILNNSKITNNTAYGRAAALLVRGANEVQLNNTIVEKNTSTLHGVTVNIEKTDNFLFDSNSIVRNNTGGEAAGIYVTDSNATISGTIENNTATDGNGGGLYTALYESTKIVTVTSSAKIINNKAKDAGGGIYINGAKDNISVPGKVIINGAIVEGNTASGTPAEETLKDGGGAGIYVARGILEINDITIKNNTSECNIGNAIIVSHANGNINAGKLTINGGNISGSIAVGIGSLNITGGTYTENVEDYITSEYNITQNNGYYIVSENKVLETEDNNITFESDSIIDKNYSLNVILLDEEEHKQVTTKVEEKYKTNTKIMDTKLLFVYDISIKDGNDIINVDNGNYTISIKIDKKLQIYDNYQVVYIDDDGNIKETLDAKLEDGKIVFNTTHLSTYGIVGYNDVVETIKTPQTFDGVTISIVTAIISVFGFIGASLSLKKRVSNK